MNALLWTIAAVLAVAFLAAGLMKLTQPRAKLVSSGQGWAEGYSDGAVKALGAVEVLGAVGLVLPALVDVATVLVPLAATGLAILMIGAIVVHTRRREIPNVVVNVVLLALTVFLAVERFGPHAF
ncbi:MULTISPECIES: DoxX family protein [unclassified Modestobacter]